MESVDDILKEPFDLPTEEKYDTRRVSTISDLMNEITPKPPAVKRDICPGWFYDESLNRRVPGCIDCNNGRKYMCRMT
jgi:hypothetical protein